MTSATTGHCRPRSRHDWRSDALCSWAGHSGLGGAGGIRTLDRALQPYNGLANRRLQPLGHSSMSADMPDARASRKRQIQITPGPLGGRRRFACIFHPHGGPRSGPSLWGALAGGWSHTRLRNRVNLIRCPQRADSTPAVAAVPDRCAQPPRLAALQRHSARGKCRASSTFRRLFVPVGRLSTARHRSQPVPARDEPRSLSL